MTDAVPRHHLVGYLDTLLDAATGTDYCPNGLQVEGREEIRRMVTGVSVCRELFERAIALEADAILVHHGLFWSGDEQRLVGILRQRVKLLLDAEISLLAYHLPLDRHAEYGNNILAARNFGIEAPEPFGKHEGRSIGFAGLLPAPLTCEEFEQRCAAVFGQPPIVASGGGGAIRTAAFVSGAAEGLFREAISRGYDAYVTGEISEWVMNVARESGVHFFAAGHYATERLGIAALGEHLAEQFGLAVEFVDVPNPV
jgi:dinuclear metal center YbgI/SA1388 family protein